MCYVFDSDAPELRTLFAPAKLTSQFKFEATTAGLCIALYAVYFSFDGNHKNVTSSGWTKGKRIADGEHERPLKRERFPYATNQSANHSTKVQLKAKNS